MIRARFVGLVPVFCLAASLAGSAPAPAAGEHVMIQESELTWVDGPPSLPPGQKIAVLSGNPGLAGPFTIRARVPAGYRIPPHWHPSDEHVTVLSGTFAMGLGESFDAAALHDLTAGGFARMPATVRHYALARTEAVLQIHGTGPLVVNYVNPADDPLQKAKK